MSQPNDFWCPHGRVSIQRIASTGSVIEAVPTGAFNMAVQGDRISEGVYLTSRCTAQCAHYRRRLFFGRWRRGRCGLEPASQYGPAFLLAIILSASVIGFKFL